MKKYLLLALLALGLRPLPAHASGPKIVFMIGEEEYQTWITLPEFAQTDLKPLGYQITIVRANEADKYNFPGLISALRDADLLFLSVRRRPPPIAQMDAVRAYLDSGRPLVGIRTACHAFLLLRAKLTNPKLEDWVDFGRDVIGCHYSNHYGNVPMATVAVAPGAENNPILRGVSASTLAGTESLYAVSPLVEGTVPLLIATIPNHPAQPIAWTHTYGPNHARIFYTSLGGPKDFPNPNFRRLLVNGVAWALGK